MKRSPLAGIENPAEDGEPEHILNDDELVAIYLAAQKLGHPLATSYSSPFTQDRPRRSQIPEMEHITDDHITLPGEIERADPFR